MNLPRVVDSEVPDHWSDCGRSVRAALDCFVPLAITIRAMPDGYGPRGAFKPRPRQAVR